MYADQVTPSMERAISETNRRRKPQVDYNLEHGIDPQTIRKAVTDILAYLRPAETPWCRARTGARTGRSTRLAAELLGLPGEELGRLIRTLTEEMHEASADLRFEVRGAVAGRDQAGAQARSSAKWG